MGSSRRRLSGLRRAVGPVLGILLALGGTLGPAAATTSAAPSAPVPASSPAPVAPAPAAPASQAASRALCGTPAHDSVRCFALMRTDIAPVSKDAVTPNVAVSGLSPTDLQSAYGLAAASASGGSGITIAIVDAYDLPNAESDLATYRTQFGLPACTTANGCFRKVDQRGGTSYPAADAGWGVEIALDIEMASAICPQCKILLVEADSATMANMGAAENRAVAMGAQIVSNSFGTAEFLAEPTADSAYFDHPGVTIVASTGDSGYGSQFPAASPHVVAVGGTSLTKTSTPRGWSETAWSGAGSGCSAYEPKPTWQSDAGCAMRSIADVSAVANPATGVAIYTSAGGGWGVAGGTSASAPIIAGVYALAGAPASSTYPGSYPYLRGGLLDVTSGSNGSCGGSYLCTAGAGYDGPTGLGTPYGTASFTSANVPSQPRSPSAVAGSSSATVSWTAPVSAGDSAITGYTATAYPGGQTCTWTSGALSCSISGLTNGTAYAFNVTATNGQGTGPFSVWSNSVTPSGAATVPGAPTGVTAVAGNASATVSWTAPASNGGSSITGYTVTSSTGSKTCTWSTGPLSCVVSGLTNGTAYTFTVTATNGVGTGSASSASNSVTPISGATFHAVSPTRYLDSRYGVGFSGAISAYTYKTFQVAGRTVAGVTIPSGTLAVTGNLTVTGQTGKGYLYIGPDGTTSPPASTLNFPVGDNRANGVTVKLSTGGSLSVTFIGSGTAHAIFDVTGYFTNDATGATFHAINPSRFLDSRYGVGFGGAIGAYTFKTFQVTGRSVNGYTLPAGTLAVTGNLTATGQTGSGYLYIGPDGTTKPPASTLNFPVGDTRANGVTVKLSGTGSLSVTFIGSGTAQAIFDITGYFTNDATGATFHAISPSRFLDSRYSVGFGGAITAYTFKTFQVTSRSVNGYTLPAGTLAVTGNLTVTGQTGKGYLYIGPDGTTSPPASTLNFPVGDTRANGVTVKLSGTGSLSVTFIGSGTAQAIFDITGYFTTDATS